MCQRKDCGPRCYSDSNAALTAATNKLAKLDGQLDAANLEIASLHKEGLTSKNQRRLNSLMKLKTDISSKISVQVSKKRSVLRDVDGTKTGRKQLEEAISKADFGSKEWKELDFRRRNAEANHFQRVETLTIVNAGVPAPIRLVRKAA